MDRLSHILLLALVLCSTIACVAGIPASTTNKHSREIVVFGDSVSDDGNVFKLTNGTWPADPAYFKGRFSNGPVWVEVMANKLGLKLNDFAFGGATSDDALVQGFTGPNSTIPVPSATDQVAAYLSGKKTNDIRGNLFAILIGANDIFFNPNIRAYPHYLSNSYRGYALLPQKKLPRTWGPSSINSKVKVGANKFVVASYPDLASLPLKAFNTPEGTQLLHDYSSAFQTEIAKLASSRSHIAYANGYALFQRFFANPQHFGFDPNVVGKSCLTGAYGEAPRTLCDNPDEYVFWDEFHPSRKSHRLFAEVALKTVSKSFS